MKKCYVTPEMEIVEFDKKDVILTSPTENELPDQGGVNLGDPSPGDIPDDLGSI